jgi:cytochrome c oxidase subunit IV
MASAPARYFLVFLILVALTGCTIGIALVRFSDEIINALLALFIAIVKGSLVALFFMHLRFEGRLIYAIFILPLVLCLLIVFALIPDIVLTGYNDRSASMHVFNPPPVMQARHP